MTAAPAVRVDRLGKRYEIGSALDFGARLTERVGRFRAPRDPGDSTIWALRNVTFEIAEGEAVGVIGGNGAGKTTLLKILSRITYPTEGQAELHGRVASLLEVGTGFHPDLTGRENIYLNGAILGMRRAETRRRFDEIVEFAEVGQFLDTPVKRYSSGMYVRLAFAVAAHLEPDILLVDEVLSVGDASFQRKCLGRMHEAASTGRTVVFVSHDLGSVSNLTTRAVLLAGGTIAAVGPTRDVIRTYLSGLRASGDGPARDVTPFRRSKSVAGPVTIAGINAGSGGSDGNWMEVGEALAFEISVAVTKPTDGITLTAAIKDENGRAIALLFSPDQDYFLDAEVGMATVGVKIRDLPLVPGMYYVDVGLNQGPASAAYDVIQDFPLIQVRNHGQIVQWLDRPFGAVHPTHTQWERKQ